MGRGPEQTLLPGRHADGQQMLDVTSCQGNANQHYNEHHLAPLRKLAIQYGGSSEHQEQSYHLIQHSVFWIFTQKTQKRAFKDTRTPTFIAALLTAAQTWRQLVPVTRGPGEGDVVCIYSGHSSARRKEERLPFVTTRMGLQNVKLSEISQKTLRAI